MKLMIASDIHGSAASCEMMLERFQQEEADRIVLLGDILYHGPRNDLPERYDPKAVIRMLNAVKKSLLCVRGNCDAEVDQMVLEFPILAECALLFFDNRVVYATHGHHSSEECPPPIGGFDILLCGHTHIPKCAVHDGFIYMNPGSVTIEKNGFQRSYMVYSDGIFSWKRLYDKEVFMEKRFN